MQIPASWREQKAMVLLNFLKPFIKVSQKSKRLKMLTTVCSESPRGVSKPPSELVDVGMLQLLQSTSPLSLWKAAFEVVERNHMQKQRSHGLA